MIPILHFQLFQLLCFLHHPQLIQKKQTIASSLNSIIHCLLNYHLQNCLHKPNFNQGPNLPILDRDLLTSLPSKPMIQDLLMQNFTLSLIFKYTPMSTFTLGSIFCSTKLILFQKLSISVPYVQTLLAHCTQPQAQDPSSNNNPTGPDPYRNILDPLNYLQFNYKSDSDNNNLSPSHKPICKGWSPQSMSATNSQFLSHVFYICITCPLFLQV